MNTGDSVRGAVRMSSATTQQQRVRFVPLSGAAHLTFRPRQLRAYGYVQGADTLRYVAWSLAQDAPATQLMGLATGRTADQENGLLFLRQLVAGPVQLYERYEAVRGRGESGFRRLWLLRTGNQGFVNTYWWNFPRDAAAYFHQCPSLVAALQQRRYRARDLVSVVRQYNRQCVPAR